MRRPYPSDITREQFAIILPILEKSRKKTKPRAVDLYEVFCGILYLLNSGCQWRMIPSDSPDWEICYYYCCRWKHKPHKDKDSLLEEAFKKCGWRGETQQWAERKNQLGDC